MGRLTKAAVLIVAAAVAAETLGQVMGYTSFNCSDEITYEYPSAEEACASYDVNAYRSPSTGVYECTVCASDPAGPPIILPPPIIIIVPACPAGQHLDGGGGCHSDHECGDDEIGGGSEECEECGEGEVPNEGGTACVSCQYGESGTSGVCAADPCGLAAVDAAAAADLKGVPRKGQEQGRFLYCEGDKLRRTAWTYSGEDKCYVTITRKYGRDDTCWRKSPRPSECNLAGIHTHPYFTKADLGATCGDEIISDERMAIKHNTQGMSFGLNDWLYSVANDVDSYLGVPNRSCVMGNRVASGDSLKVTVWAREGGECKPYEHVPWSDE